MKKLSIILSILALGACTIAPPPERCAQIGLDTDNPNYLRPYDFATLSSFYACTRRNLDLDTDTNIFGLMMPHSVAWPGRRNPFRNLDYEALDYQWELWQQIYARQLSPPIAQSRWALYDNWLQGRHAEINAAIERQREADQERANEQEAEDAQDADNQATDSSSGSASNQSPEWQAAHDQVQQQLARQGIKWH